jgi:hypothetical protein
VFVLPSPLLPGSEILASTCSKFCIFNLRRFLPQIIDPEFISSMSYSCFCLNAFSNASNLIGLVSDLSSYVLNSSFSVIFNFYCGCVLGIN